MLYGMEMDVYKSRFLDGCPDGIMYKHKILRAGVSNCMRMCLNLFGNKHSHSSVPGLKGEAILLSFFFSLVPVSIILIGISFSNCQIFYFRSLLTIRSLSLTLISPM